MCGIFFSNFVPNDVSSIIKDLSKRGPDGTNYIEVKVSNQDCFALHSLLSIETVGTTTTQPYPVEKKGFFIFNGEIFNYKEIAKKWGIKVNSDTELIGELLVNRSLEDVIQEFIGPFAIIFLQKNGTIEFCRDFLGEKPLFFSACGSRFVASSSERAIASCIQLSVNNILAKQFIKGGFSTTGSVFNEVNAAMPGRVYKLNVSGGSLTHVDVQPLNLDNLSISFDDFTHSFDRCLKLVEPKKIKYSVFFSGGADSSYLLSRINDEKIISIYTLAGDGVVNSIGKKHKILQANYDSDFIFEYIRALSSPLGDPAGLGFYQLSKAAREDSKVVLCGDGVDELLETYPKNRLLNKFLPNWLHCFVLDFYFFKSFISKNRLTISKNLEYSGRFDAGSRMPNYLMSRSDLPSMSAGVEIRSPFLLWPNFKKLDGRIFKNNISIKKRMLNSVGYTKIGFPSKIDTINKMISLGSGKPNRFGIEQTSGIAYFRAMLLDSWLISIGLNEKKS
jgi:asparagine synthase (glutamine-hydrolysing)